jgi:hypothetical protein
MKKTILLSAISSALWGQPNYVDPVRPEDVIPGGAINGKPIDPVVFKAQAPCALVKDRIQRAARDEAAQSLGITVTPEDIAAYLKTVRPFDPVAMSKEMIGKATMALAAFEAIDKGQDPHQVYLQMVKPTGMLEQDWSIYLTQKNNPKFRAMLTKQLTLTPDVLAKSYAKSDWSYQARYLKLDNAVDQILIKNDATFKVAFDHWKASERVNPDRSVQHSGVPVEEHQYMEKQRASWWKGRVSMLTVTLNDPTLAARCNLRNIGVATR